MYLPVFILVFIISIKTIAKAFLIEMPATVKITYWLRIRNDFLKKIIYLIFLSYLLFFILSTSALKVTSPSKILSARLNVI